MEKVEINFLEQANKSQTSYKQEDKKSQNGSEKYRKVFPITIILEQNDLDFFNEYCHKNYLKRSAVVRKLVKDFFDNLKDK